MDKPRTLLHALFRRLRLDGEDGSVLIEVMIGAVMVVVISGAILNGLSGAQDTGERNKSRTVSASLAQQDQERMRAMPVDDLSNHHDIRNLNVAGVTYTVDSRSVWVDDENGTVSCTNDSTQAQYMKISSTVSSEISKEKPLTTTSLVSPPRGTFSVDSGTAAVQVVDRDQNPLSGVRVDISGPGGNLSDVTNDIGCVVFGFIPEGPWKLEISSLGLVGWDGSSPYKADVGVVGGATVLKKIELDKPSSIRAGFETKVGAAAPVVAKSSSISVANSHLPSPGWKPFTVAAPALNVTADKLFPFADGYGVYAGSCEPNNPAKYDPEYFAGVGASAYTITPQGGESTVTVRVPAINVKVTDSTGAVRPLARVFVKNSDATCTETYPMQTSDAAGALPEPGFPFGHYTVCADDAAGHMVQTAVGGVDNTNPDGTATTHVLQLPLATTGNCAL